MPISQKLTVIEKPKENTRTVIKLNKKNETVIIRGQGSIDFLCGRCGAKLAESVVSGQIKNIVLYCNKCGSYNETESGYLKH